MSTTVRLFCMVWLTAVALLSGCSTVNSVVPPSTDLDFKVSKQVNPDPNGRPSPLVVRIYELSSRSVFDSQDFFALYDNPDQVLSQYTPAIGLDQTVQGTLLIAPETLLLLEMLGTKEHAFAPYHSTVLTHLLSLPRPAVPDRPDATPLFS